MLVLATSVLFGSGAAMVSGEIPERVRGRTPHETAAPASSALAPDAAVRAEACRTARAGLRWYVRWFSYWRSKTGAGGSSRAKASIGRKAGPLPGAACPRYLAKVYRAKAHGARKQYERWLREHVLVDVRSWTVAVHLVQRFFPGTASWLLSCSDAEGYNRGDPTRWVVYGGGSFNMGAWYSDTVGGPLQFRPSTFKGMYRRGLAHISSRGYRVPAYLRDSGTTTAWRSMLAQAIAGGWARWSGNDDSHWSASWGNGC